MMATLRAAAFILNFALLALALFHLATEGLPKVEDLVIFLLLIGSPIVSTATIAMLSRSAKP